MPLAALDKKSRIIYGISEYLYLLVLAFYVFRNFVYTSVLPMLLIRNGNFSLRAGIVCMVVILFRIGVSYAYKLISYKQLFVMMLLTFFGYLAYLYSHTYYGNNLFIPILLLIGAINISYKKLLSAYLLTKIPSIIYSIRMSVIGKVPDLIYVRGNQERHSYGIGYCTDFAAHCFFILVFYSMFRGYKITYKELAVIGGIGCVLLWKSGARCSFMCAMLLVFIIFILKFFKYGKFNRGNKKINPVIAKVGEVITKIGHSKAFLVFCILLPYLFFAMMVILSHTAEDNKFAILLDKLISNRIMLSREAFARYDLNLWGQVVNLVSNGGTTEPVPGYFFIDCSYLFIAFLYGIVYLVVVLTCMDIIIYKNKKNLLFIGIIVVILFHSLIEHHLSDITHNVLFVLPLADWEYKEWSIKALFKKNASKEA